MLSKHFASQKNKFIILKSEIWCTRRVHFCNELQEHKNALREKYHHL